MEELNVCQWLIFKKPEEDGPLVRGGHADALVVHATNAVKNGTYYILNILLYVFIYKMLLLLQISCIKKHF